MVKRLLNSLYPKLSFGPNAKEKKKSDVLLLVIALGVAAAASGIFIYNDMVDMITNSNLLLKSLFEGKFTEYYTYTLERSTSSCPANYDFPLYLLFAIWNLPFALIFHFEANGVVVLWFKVLVILCVAICAGLMYKIYRLFEEEDHFTGGSFLLLMLSSPLVFLSEFVACQYDCISMILILAGLYEYLKGRDLRSLICFCLAVPIKTFAIFLFIPLLVYKEKNVIKILLKTGFVFIIPFFCKLLFRGDPAYSFLLASQNRDAAKLLLDASVRIADIEIHLFLLLFLLICFFCYFRKYEKSKVLLIAAAVYTSFVLFIPIRSYWVFLAEPFFLLLIATKPRLFKVNFFVHAAAAVSGSLFFLYSHSMYNSTEMTRNLLLLQLGKLPSVVKYGSFSNFINVHGWGVYMPILRTFFIGSCLALLVICAVEPKKLRFSTDFSPRIVTWIKCAVIVGILGAMVFVEMYPTSLPVIDTLDYSQTQLRPYIIYNDAAATQANEPEQTEKGDAGDTKEIGETGARYYPSNINAGAVIEQPFELKEARTVSRICFQCYNTDSTRPNRVRLNVSLVDTASQKVLRETTVGASLVITGEIYMADFEKIDLPQGNYCIRITNIEALYDVPFTDSAIYMMCSPGSRTAEPALIDGRQTAYPVCVCVN